MALRAHPVRTFVSLFALLAGGGAAALWWWLGLHALPAWLVAANLVAPAFWAWDKRQARTGGFRVPETALHAFAFAGAAVASLAAMRVLRHKTLKPSFRWLYGAFLVLQVGALAWWWRAQA